jgi:hypothetical protein
VIARFPQWREAFGEISWERYLERIIKLKETGDSSKEAARFLLSKRETAVSAEVVKFGS